MNKILLSLFLASSIAQAQAPVSGIMQPLTTRAWDNARTGWNQHETILNVTNVKTQGLRKYFTLPMEGDARGTEAQPLILPSVLMPDGHKRDVGIVTSMNCLVYAFDVNSSDILWTQKLGIPVKGNASIDMHQINDHWCNLSTGVIDPDTSTWYGVAVTSPDGNPRKGTHAVYALKLSTGQFAAAPAPLAGQTYKPVNGALQTWDSQMRKQRSSLVMTNIHGVKTIFFASGTVLETTNGAAGWVFAYDVAKHKIVANLTMTAGDGAGIWMAGQGLIADANGFLYGVTGNGAFNGTDNFGECAFKLQYTPDTANKAAKLAIVDWWAPYTDAGRIGQDPTLSAPTFKTQDKVAGVSEPSERMQMPVNGMKPRSLENARIVGNLVYPALDPNDAAYSDEDLGSAQGAFVAQYSVYVVAGKDGIGYPVNAKKMGKTMPADFANAKANCAKLASPPVWLTASPGPVDACPQDPTTLNFLPWGKTRHMHSTPVQYMSPTHGLTIFAWGENSQLHAWGMSPTGALTYLAQGAAIASANIANSPGGMPGGFMSISSNGTKAGTALLVATIPYGDANARVTNGRLLVYDPENFVNNPDGTKSLAVLWDSEAENIPFVFNKFDPPVVNGGKVFVPNYADGVDVYGLAGQ